MKLEDLRGTWVLVLRHVDDGPEIFVGVDPDELVRRGLLWLVQEHPRRMRALLKRVAAEGHSASSLVEAIELEGWSGALEVLLGDSPTWTWWLEDVGDNYDVFHATWAELGAELRRLGRPRKGKR